MTKPEKAGRGKIVLVSVAFILISFMLLGLVYDNASKKAKELQRIERELPLGTLERMKHEVLQSVRTDDTVSVEQDGSHINIQIKAFDVPAFELKELDFQMEYTAILKAVHRSGFNDFKTMMISSEAPLIDKLGNKTPDIIAFATFDKTTLDKVNWENFIHTNLEALTMHYEFNTVVKREQ